MQGTGRCRLPRSVLTKLLLRPGACVRLGSCGVRVQVFADYEYGPLAYVLVMLSVFQLLASRASPFSR